MRQYFAPLGTFLFLNLLLLIPLALFPAVSTAQTQLETDMAPIAATFWGLSWVVSGTRLWIFLIFEGMILFITGKLFLGLKR